jgi:hypothetical protein
MLDTKIAEAIKSAFIEGKLEVQGTTPEGSVDWYPIKDVMRHNTGHKRAFQVSCNLLEVIATEDHSLFVYEEGLIQVIATKDLKVGDMLAIVFAGNTMGVRVTQIREVPPMDQSYDLCVPGPENFVLSNGIIAHNSYSIGGVSLDLDKSSKYESSYSAVADQFDKMLEKAKLTVKIIAGLQQPRYGMGIRSSFGPYVGAGVLNPRKFIS